ncbi:MAG: hypothetical protein RIS91_426 [Bacteroidota bacterium]
MKAISKRFISNFAALKKVSIITAVYNRKDTLARAMDSVVSQTYKHIEYIVIDGNSTDGSKEVIENYRDQLDVYISENDRGIYDALNKGLQSATGDIVGFLHSDDYLADNTVIEKIVEAMDGCDAVYGDLEFFDRANPKAVTRFYSSKFFSPWMLRMALQPAHPTFYAKREVYNSVGQFNLNYKISADFDWFVRFFSTTPEYKFKYQKLTSVRMQTGGASTGGLKSLYNHNKEDLVILKENGIYSNWGFVLLKFVFKLTQIRF